MNQYHHQVDVARVWLVTGCSSGQGRSLVTAILARGDKVIATARRIADLDFISQEYEVQKRAFPITLDVTDTFDQLREAIDKAVAHFGAIDVLVNNAGFIVSGVWEELT
jgi:NAD(P)-dependent dehydrogenase (short-subunit alcohol dehydrogenase family)